ncbi:MAG: HAMP domain-containing protein [Desulfobacteraceae bacterium]|nr:MAG: HAMP domain-containing protein [Desulfobacteraceae bacterium]
MISPRRGISCKIQVIAWAISKPIKALAEQAKKTGTGCFEQKTIYRSKDALGRLADSFNQMVSDLKRAEEFRRRYDFIVNTSKDLNSLINRNYVYEAVNEAYCSAQKRPRQDIIGSTVAGIWGEKAFQERIKGHLERCFTGEEVNYQALFDIPLLGLQYFNVTYYPYRDSENDVTHSVVISHNITKQKHVEDSLRVRVEEMTALNAFGQQVGASLSLDQVIKASIEGIIAPVQPDMVMLYLMEGTELVLKGMHTEDPQIDKKKGEVHRLGECLCGLAPIEKKPIYSMDISRDIRCVRNESRESGLQSFAALPLQRGDRIIGVMGLASRSERNFSEQSTFLETLAGEAAISLENAILYEQIQRHADDLEKRVAERTAELEIAMEKAKEADQLKSAFLAAMSHELRTPLNSIIGFTGILLQGLVGALNEEQKKQLGMVKESAHHLLSLINDVLDISKIEAGQLDLFKEPFDLREAIVLAVKTLTPLAGKKGLSMEIDMPPEMGRITSDRRRVEQILINLINNAVKFTDKGKVSVHAEIVDSDRASNRPEDCTGSTQKVKYAEVKVIDTGIGIKDEDIGRLFKAFQQIETGLARRFEGTGLGLSICKKLVGLLGGEIYAESAGSGKGSVFSFRLPLA